MSTTRTIRRAAGVGGTILALTAVVAVTQATGGAATNEPANPSRAQAILAATQGELADTQHRVGDIQLEQVVDGREIYSLRGSETACILVAGVDQEAGRSQSLACTNTAEAVPERPMRTGFELTSGRGYVDLVSVDDGAPSQVVATSSATDVHRGARVVVAVRSDDSRSGALRWSAPSGAAVTVPLSSRDERAALTAPVE